MSDSQLENKSNAFLEILAGPDEGRQIPLHAGEQILGRNSEIALPDNSVSRAHVSLTLDSGKLVLTDLGSHNGTLINNRRVTAKTATPLKTGDEITVGIYLLKVGGLPELIAEQPPLPASVKTEELQNNTSSNNELKSDDELEPVLDEESKLELQKTKNRALVPFDGELPDEGLVSTRIKNFFYGIGLVVALGGLSVLLFRFYQKRLRQQKENPPVVATEVLQVPTEGEGAVVPPESVDKKAVTPPVEVEQKPAEPVVAEPQKAESTSINNTPPSMPQEPVAVTQIPAVSEQEKSPTTINTFLDLTSKPLPARVTLNGQDLGKTPIKASVKVVAGQEYELAAEFELRDVRDSYLDRKIWIPKQGVDVNTVVFAPPLGKIEVRKLPRNTEFLLTGFYSYDTEKSNPISLNHVMYGTPVYLPYGNYHVELREKTQIPSSKSFVSEIRYIRDFVLSSDNQQIILNIDDKQLTIFPANIQSVPTGAKLYLDGKEIGQTPFVGDLPLGQHDLVVNKEGYFESVVPLDVRANTQFESTIELKTSLAGEMINKARELKIIGDARGAVNQLVDALKRNPTDHEKGEIYYLLGQCFEANSEDAEALAHYARAKENTDFYFAGLLGEARVLFSQGDRNAAFPKLVEVLLNLPEHQVKEDDLQLNKEAHALFGRMSPIKSVMYIQTDPAGATVILNGQEMTQKTPLILSDLGLGNYKIEIRKEGYQTELTRKNLTLSDFEKIFYKLK